MGTLPQRSSEFAASVILFSDWFILCRAKSMSQLEKSWMFLIRVIWKVGMKWATIEEEEGVNILLQYVCCVVWRLHIQIHTLFSESR